MISGKLFMSQCSSPVVAKVVEWSQRGRIAVESRSNRRWNTALDREKGSLGTYGHTRMCALCVYMWYQIEGRQSNHHHSRQNDYSSHSHNERTKSSSSRMDTAPPPRRLDGDQDMRFRSSSSDRVRRHSAEDRRHHATPTHTVNNNNFSFSLVSIHSCGGVVMLAIVILH